MNKTYRGLLIDQIKIYSLYVIGKNIYWSIKQTIRDIYKSINIKPNGFVVVCIRMRLNSFWPFRCKKDNNNNIYILNSKILYGDGIIL